MAEPHCTVCRDVRDGCVKDYSSDPRTCPFDARTPAGPGGCIAAVNLRGEHFWCEERAPHVGIPHGSKGAGGLVWRGVGDDEDFEAAWRRVDPESAR